MCLSSDKEMTRHRVQGIGARRDGSGGLGDKLYGAQEDRRRAAMMATMRERTSAQAPALGTGARGATPLGG